MKVLKRVAVITAAAIAVAGGLYGYARYVEPNMLTVNNHHIDTNKIDTSIKVVLFSDTHFGRFTDPNGIERIVSKINEMNADIVIFAGDFVDSYYRDKSMLDTDYFSTQLNLINARYGKFCVWGNHDRGGGFSRIYNDMMESGGFALLKNESVFLDEIGITISGLDDLLLGDPKTDITANSFHITATHAPDIVDDIVPNAADLFVAGHSHGGQVRLPFISKKILPVGAKRYIGGEYSLDGDRNSMLIVSRGIGLTGLPFRFFSVPEINVIEIS